MVTKKGSSGRRVAFINDSEVGLNEGDAVPPFPSESRLVRSTRLDIPPAAESASEALHRFIHSEKEDIVNLARKRTEDAISKAAAAQATEKNKQQKASSAWQNTRQRMIARLRSEKSFRAKFGTEDDRPTSSALLLAGAVSNRIEVEDELSPMTPARNKPTPGILGVVAMHDRLLTIKEAARAKPKARTQKQVDRIAKFLKESPRFQDYGSHVLRTCGRRMEGVAYAHGELVYSAGDRSTAMYIVLQGSLHRVAEADDPAPLMSPSPHGSARGYRTTSMLRSSTSGRRRSGRRFNSIPTSEDIHIHDVFGEEDLMVDCPRESTVTCTSTSGCLLLMLEKGLYDDIVRGDLSGALTEEVASLKMLSEFSHIADSVLAGFVFCFYECEFDAGAQITQQAKLRKDESATMYWIMSGTVECYTDPCFDYSRPEATPNPDITQTVRLCEVHTGGVIGDTSLIMPDRVTRTTMALTPTKLLSVSVANMKKRAPKSVVSKMTAIAESKLEYEEMRCRQELRHAANIAPGLIWETSVVSAAGDDGSSSAVNGATSQPHANRSAILSYYDKDERTRQSIAAKTHVKAGYSLWRLQDPEPPAAAERQPHRPSLRASASAIGPFNKPSSVRQQHTVLPQLAIPAGLKGVSGRRICDVLRRSMPEKGDGVGELEESMLLTTNHSYELDLRRHGLVVPAIEDELSELLDELSLRGRDDTSSALVNHARTLAVPGYEDPLAVLTSAVTLPALLPATAFRHALEGHPSPEAADGVLAHQGSSMREAGDHAWGEAEDCTLTAPPSLHFNHVSSYGRLPPCASVSIMPAVAHFKQVDRSGVAKQLHGSVKLASGIGNVGTPRGFQKGAIQRPAGMANGGRRKTYKQRLQSGVSGPPAKLEWPKSWPSRETDDTSPASLDHRTKQVMVAAMVADRSRALARLLAGKAPSPQTDGHAARDDRTQRNHRSAGAPKPREPWQSLADYRSVPKVLQGNSAQVAPAGILSDLR